MSQEERKVMLSEKGMGAEWVKTDVHYTSYKQKNHSLSTYFFLKLVTATGKISISPFLSEIDLNLNLIR